MKLFDAVNNACRDLPEGYVINLHMENGSGYVELLDPEYNGIDFSSEDSPLDEQIDEAVLAAKSAVNKAVDLT